MSQAEIDEWNRTKPTTHDESQMGYGRADYEQARKESEKVWDNPNAHVGGPYWVGKMKVMKVGLNDNKKYKIHQQNNFMGSTPTLIILLFRE